jgi:hypothetical protein
MDRGGKNDAKVHQEGRNVSALLVTLSVRGCCTSKISPLRLVLRLSRRLLRKARNEPRRCAELREGRGER